MSTQGESLINLCHVQYDVMLYLAMFTSKISSRNTTCIIHVLCDLNFLVYTPSSNDVPSLGSSTILRFHEKFAEHKRYLVIETVPEVIVRFLVWHIP